VNESKELIGEDSFLCSAERVTKLKQKSLFAFAKSYADSRIVASGPGLELISAANPSGTGERHTVLRI
jgi:hypothetical protein